MLHGCFCRAKRNQSQVLRRNPNPEGNSHSVLHIQTLIQTFLGWFLHSANERLTLRSGIRNSIDWRLCPEETQDAVKPNIWHTLKVWCATHHLSQCQLEHGRERWSDQSLHCFYFVFWLDEYLMQLSFKGKWADEVKVKSQNPLLVRDKEGTAVDECLRLCFCVMKSLIFKHLPLQASQSH